MPRTGPAPAARGFARPGAAAARWPARSFPCPCCTAPCWACIGCHMHWASGVGPGRHSGHRRRQRDCGRRWKDPVTLALARHLRDGGWSPGIVSRGYGRSTDDCREARPDSAPADVGDEPALLARASGVPVFVARKRIEAVQALRARHPQVDVVISDDGLQHLALARDIELCVFNDDGIGNGWLLPAGRCASPGRAPSPPCCMQAQPRHRRPAFAMQRQLSSEAVNAQGERIALSSCVRSPWRPWPPWPGPRAFLHADPRARPDAGACPGAAGSL